MKKSHPLLVLVGALATTLSAALASPIATAQKPTQKPHSHGTVHLEVIVDDKMLALRLDAPLEAVVGFEHTPRTPAQVAAVEAMQALWSDGGKLFKPSAAAECTAGDTDAYFDSSANAQHADVVAQFSFTCKKLGALKSIEVLLMDHHPRVQRIEVQTAGPQGQRKQTLKRGQKVVQLRR